MAVHFVSDSHLTLAELSDILSGNVEIELDAKKKIVRFREYLDDKLSHTISRFMELILASDLYTTETSNYQWKSFRGTW